MERRVYLKYLDDVRSVISEPVDTVGRILIIIIIIIINYTIIMKLKLITKTRTYKHFPIVLTLIVFLNELRLYEINWDFNLKFLII